MRKFIAAFFVCLIIIPLAILTVNAEKYEPLYIFLFIADGMGENQYLAAQSKGLTNSLDSLSLKSYVITHAFNNVTTDSSAAATAIATGVKTHNGILGLSAKGEKIENIVEAAIKSGMGTGIVSNMSLNHATPAGFYAHIKSRTAYYEIGLQLITSNINYFGGGGFYHHRGKEKNKKSLYTLAEQAGYEVFKDGILPNINELKNGNKKIISINPVLRSDACMPYIDKRPKNSRKLADYTNEAIQILSDNKAGFLIIIEGGNIDYACHDNEFDRMLHEIADFDEALSEALNFYKTRPENTLIIATGDHETGGLIFVPKDTSYISWSSKYHTRANVPIFAIGIKSDEFTGVSGLIDNTDIAKVLFRLINTGIN